MKNLVAISVCGIALVGGVHADSLYPGSSTAATTITRPVSLFTDDKAKNVGDTLTIIVSENASAASSANTKNSKNENLNYGPGFGLILRNIPAFGLGGNIGSTATGTTDRTDNLNAEITVTVTKVLPNGNLLVEGHRKVGINAETQTITLTGVVRPADISTNNTILSPLVADAQIAYSGKGPVGDKQHDGIIARIFKFLF